MYYVGNQRNTVTNKSACVILFLTDLILLHDKKRQCQVFIHMIVSIYY